MSSTRTRTPEGLLRWDVGRDEPYLLIPGFPDLRLTPFRRGDDEQLVRLHFFCSDAVNRAIGTDSRRFNCTTTPSSAVLRSGDRTRELDCPSMREPAET
jgi:hypothetical protein